MRTTTATTATALSLLLFAVVSVGVASAQSDGDANTTTTGGGGNTNKYTNTYATDYDPPTTLPKPSPKSRHITVDEWETFLQSESGTEFEFNDNPIKARSEWDDAVEFEWGRCLAEEGAEVIEGAKRKKCSYVLCHEGANMSGWKRKKEIIDFIVMEEDIAADAAEGGGENNATSSEESEEERYTKASELIQTIYSAEDVWCGYARMDASDAESIECRNPTDCSVTPLMCSMKMCVNTTTRLLVAIEELYGTSDLTELEDGSGGRERRRRLREERERRRRERQQSRRLNDSGEYEDINENRDTRTIRDLPKVDFHLCPGVIEESDIESFMGNSDNGAGAEADASNLDLTEYMTQWLLARVGSAGDGGEAVGVGVEANYWTSSRASHLRGTNDTTGRGRFWEDVFTLTLKTDVCAETYTKSLLWHADLRPSPDLSIITAMYDDSVNPGREIDQWCVVALVAGLATLTEVCTVEIRPELEVQNLYEQWLVQSGLEEKRPWFDHGLDGTGEVVAVSDTGIDQDNCYFLDAANGPVGERRDNSQRKVVQYLAFVDTTDYEYGHGTHVAGTVCGKRAVDGVTESVGMADGVAPGAKVAFLDLGDEQGYLFLPRDSYTLGTGRNARPMAHIHSASWGSVGVNYYSTQARRFDDFMFRNDDFLINVAAGNDGRGDAMNSVSSPATFKNGLAVGASHSTGDNLRFSQFGPSFLADFTSRGPTADGRISPSVVAPGKYIVSAGAKPTEAGECDGRRPSPSNGRAGVKSMAGTSMATPVVSGTAAMIRQYFREGWYPTGTKRSQDSMEVSGMLVKAVLMNGAQTNGMRGVDNGWGRVTPVSAYDNNMGFGRVDLIRSLYIEGWSDVQARVWDRQTVTDGSTNTYGLTIDRSGGCTFEDLSVTLVWVEKPSVVGCSKCVVNDLDLYITDASGTKFYPNGLDGPDRTNNAERVVIAKVQDKATYTVHVQGYNFDDFRQGYALVATGCFGGVANNLNTAQDVFENDNSKRTRNIIIIVICSVFGFILMLCGFRWWSNKKKVEAQAAEKAAAAGAEKAEKDGEMSSVKDMKEQETDEEEEKGMKNEEEERMSTTVTTKEDNEMDDTAKDDNEMDDTTREDNEMGDTTKEGDGMVDGHKEYSA